MYLRIFFRRFVLAAVIGVVGLAAICSDALTITFGPTFTEANSAPLAGTLKLGTDEASRVNISVNDGIDTWEHDFFDYDTTHSITLLGFKADRTNEISVTVFDKSGRQVTAPAPVQFVTDPLPSDFPNIVVLTNVTEKMEPGYILFRVAINLNRIGYQVIVNNSGEVVWYSSVPSQVEVRQLDNGDLFLFSTTSFMEINTLGEVVKTWSAPLGVPIDVHEGLMTDHGTILFLSHATASVDNFPSSNTDPNAPLQTVTVVYNPVGEISVTNSELLNFWSPYDELDKTRITYLTVHNAPGVDLEHANAVIEDPRDNSIIVSLRHQNAVIRFSRATGQLIWILGPHENWGEAWQKYLLSPVGTPFEWQYAQHAPVFTPQGTLLLYDDGNYRASPFEAPVPDASNYSRAVEYAIDETNMTVSQVWDYGRTNEERMYTDKVGGAEVLPETGNVLIDFGSVKYINGVKPSSYSL